MILTFGSFIFQKKSLFANSPLHSFTKQSSVKCSEHTHNSLSRSGIHLKGNINLFLMLGSYCQSECLFTLPFVLLSGVAQACGVCQKLNGVYTVSSSVILIRSICFDAV